LRRIFSTCREEAEEHFKQALSHSNPHLVAYSLVGLEQVGSKLLSNLPEGLFKRSEIIHWDLCARAGDVPLGEFAKYHVPDPSPLKVFKRTHFKDGLT